MTTSGQPEVPADLALLWGLREPGRRGPKASLSLEAIGSAAIAVADAEGLAAVSMARVAQELGAGTMSLYRYVSSKDELFLLMTELAVEPPPENLHTSGWRAGLTRWATEIDRMLGHHRWYMHIPMTRPPLGPRNLAWLEAGMQCLRDTPLSHEDRVQVVMTILMFTHGKTRILVDMYVDVDNVPQAEDNYWASLAPLLTADRFPALAEMIDVEAGQYDGDQPAASSEPAAAPWTDNSRGTEFTFGVELILDGIAAKIDRMTAG